jgi:7-cyano-7-deazaguanine synthase
LAWAETLGAFHIFIGVNSLDYSGYPDCRPEFIEAFQTMANLGTNRGVSGDKFLIETPLIHMTKAEIISTGIELDVNYGLTHSCYDPTQDGVACGSCDSCRLRKNGFKKAGLDDPIRYVENTLK